LISRSVLPFYWAPENATSEVDFIIQRDHHIVPIEVKSSENLKTRSLKLYADRYAPAHCIRTSLSGYQTQSWMMNIPLYGFLHWLSSPL
jgi:uncharacterized protein